MTKNELRTRKSKIKRGRRVSQTLKTHETPGYGKNVRRARS